MQDLVRRCGRSSVGVVPFTPARDDVSILGGKPFLRMSQHFKHEFAVLRTAKTEASLTQSFPKRGASRAVRKDSVACPLRRYGLVIPTLGSLSRFSLFEPFPCRMRFITYRQRYRK
jgi:hypothetical protein